MPPNLRALKVEMTITVGDLEDLASLLAGVVEVGGTGLPDIFYDLVDKYAVLMQELSEATNDLFGVE